MIRRQLINFQNRSVDVRVGLGAFEELSRMFAHSRGKHARQFLKRAKTDANIDTTVLEIDELTANHSNPRSKSISAQR